MGFSAAIGEVYPVREGSAEEAQFIRLTETPVPKLVVRLAIPTMCSMMITAVDRKSVV